MSGIGVIGVGYWGPNLVRNFHALDTCAGVAVADFDSERLAEMGRRHPGIQTTTDHRDLLNDSDVVGIAIATPVSTHFELARESLLAGKSVFVEKPLARTSAECSELIALARDRQLVLMVGHTFEYNAAVKQVEEYISANVLGEIYYIYAQRLNLGVVRQDVNAMWNLAPHDISIALRWLKRMPVSVNATGHTYLQDGIEDVVFLTLRFDDGVAVNIHVSWLDPNKVRRMTVVGSERMVVYDDATTENKIQLFDKGIDRRDIGGNLGGFDSFGKFQLIHRAGDITIPRVDFVEPLRVECLHFLDCIRGGETPATDGENGLRVVRILEAADLSLAAGGQSVAID